MKNNVLILTLFSLLLLFGSCSTKEDNLETGRLIVQLTDAPYPHDLVAEANVTIYKIEARRSGNEEEMDESASEEEMNSPEEDGSPYVLLMEEEIEVNLLDLTNGVTETLVDADVPVGSYDLVRIYVKGVNVVLKDETTFSLTVPSGYQTGIKVFIKPPLMVEGGLTADLLLDFDVSRSFVQKGNGLGFHFKPVIKASNKSTAGTISGIVTTLQDTESVGLEGALITLYAADTVNTTTFTDASGMYTLMGVEGGTYDVMAEATGYLSQTTEGVGVVPANKTTVDFELEAEE